MELKKKDDKMVATINALLPQLSEKEKKLSKKDLKRIFAQPGICVFTVIIGENLAAMASIHFRETFMRKVGTIEDVVVDEKYRGKGIGRKITEMLIEEAKERKADCVELTSKPARKEAIAMYESMGFKKRETNCYRLDLLV